MIDLFSWDEHRKRRVSSQTYKLLLSAHIIVSVGWLGIVFAKLVLGLAAMTSSHPGASGDLHSSMEVVNTAFPPAAVATLVTGALLSLGTKWGLLRHYWVATKLALTVGVVVTGVTLADRLILQSISVPYVSYAESVGDGTVLGVTSAPILLLSLLSVVHVLMLGVATVLSVYKPWGKILFIRSGRRATRGPSGTGLRYR